MSLPSDPPVKSKMSYSKAGTKFLTVGGEVGCLTLIIVLLSVFGGIWLDRVLGTRPAFTILLVLASAPLSLVLTFWIARRSIQDVHDASFYKGKRNNKPEGEGTGE